MIYLPQLGKMGRLGNQLFQVAAGLALAKNRNTGLVLPSEWLKYGKYFHGPWVTSDHLPEHETIKEHGFNYRQIRASPLSFKLALQGYFQSYKYFQDQEALVRKALAWPINNREGNCFLSNEFEEKKLPLVTKPGRHHIACHIRRGDYLTFPTHFPPLPVEYYGEASGILRELIPYDEICWTLHVFSDDIPWCREMFRLSEQPPDAIHIEFHEGNTDIEDLYLITHCQHFIIANSSFSWWGAWLAPNPSKIILAPHHTQWFGHDNGFFGQTQDLIPNNWTQVKF